MIGVAAESHCRYRRAVAFPDGSRRRGCAWQARAVERALRDRDLRARRGRGGGGGVVRPRVRRPGDAAAGGAARAPAGGAGAARGRLRCPGLPSACSSVLLPFTSSCLSCQRPVAESGTLVVMFDDERAAPPHRHLRPLRRPPRRPSESASRAASPAAWARSAASSSGSSAPSAAVDETRCSSRSTPPSTRRFWWASSRPSPSLPRRPARPGQHDLPGQGGRLGSPRV